MTDKHYKRSVSMKQLTLNDMTVGSSAVVTAINCTGAMKRRLIDMGITPSVRVTLRRVAPLGDPLELKLRGYTLSIRRSEAEQILISKEDQKNDKRRARR